MMENNEYNGRCLYLSSFKDFLNEDDYSIMGKLNVNFHGPVGDLQKYAWNGEINILKSVLRPYINEKSQIIFEYNIPRLNKRIDVVLLIRGIIFCLEFKVGQNEILENDIDQVFDYAIDLADFHKSSRDRIIVPILVATESDRVTTNIIQSTYIDKVINPLITGKSNLALVIESVLNKYKNETEIEDKWVFSQYAPTPTIIEAARSLYADHSVENITLHEADGASTDRTINCVMGIINKSKTNNEKSICFVTGVPGAGKTLVGLEVAIKQKLKNENNKEEGGKAVYLSGNAPLVAVLREALAQDAYKKSIENKDKKNLTDCRREVGGSIQIIHKYRDDMLARIKNPVENGIVEIDPSKTTKSSENGYGVNDNIAIFDEAQRSWTHKRIADYLKRGGTYGNKLKVPNFPMSEAEFLIWTMDIKKDWATIVCLVGGGQEINTGEAGISEWIKAINEKFSNWKVYISPNLTDKVYAEGRIKELLDNNKNVEYKDDLHLSVSRRSFRAEKLSNFVESLLLFNKDAKEIYKSIPKEYPILLTRDMQKARDWLHDTARASERSGVLVTKEAARFKPLAVSILPNGDENAVHWFLEDKTDVRSSNYLEDAATEIQVQGLELDYACMLWDADVRYENGEWHYYRFNTKDKWNELKPDTENHQDQIKYMLNAYRVLLTRARKGIIICVPKGNDRKLPNGSWEDSTRLPEYYNGTYEYLKELGIKEIY